MDLSLETVYEDARIVSRVDRIKHFGQHDHLRIFGKDSREMLEDAGFRVTTVDEEIDLPEEILLKAGPADYDAAVVFVGRKVKGRDAGVRYFGDVEIKQGFGSTGAMETAGAKKKERTYVWIIVQEVEK